MGWVLVMMTMILVVDDDGVGGGDIDARFNNGGTQQDVVLTLVKITHGVFEFALTHLAMGNADARFGD